MFSFLRKKKKYPAFNILNAYERKDVYFVRDAPWGWLDKKDIVVIDRFAPRIITMDPWPELIFQHADGQLTVSEYVYYMAAEYDGTIPEELDDTIISELEKLVELRIVKFVDSQQRPEKPFDKAKGVE